MVTGLKSYRLIDCILMSMNSYAFMIYPAGCHYSLANMNRSVSMTVVVVVVVTVVVC